VLHGSRVDEGVLVEVAFGPERKPLSEFWSHLDVVVNLLMLEKELAVTPEGAALVRH